MHLLKRIALDAATVAAFAVLGLASWRDAMERAHRRDDWTGPLASHGPNQGDLSDMAYLDGIARFRTPVVYAFKKAQPASGRVALYLHGDSYARHIPDSAFAALHSYRFAWRFVTQLPYTLDTSLVNVLLIEIAERYVLEYFTENHFFRHVYDSARGPDPTRPDPGPAAKPFKDLPDPDAGFVWRASPNLEYLLFDYRALDPIRQAKAALAYYAFGRASGDVVVARDGRRLFLRETVTYGDMHSSYNPVSEETLGRVVDTLNAIYRHYRAEGFDTVVLSILPNSATVYQPEGYNGLIPRLQGHPRLEMPMLDAYGGFMAHPKSLYFRADTHWNNRGLNWWIGKVNEMLRGLDARKKSRTRIKRIGQDDNG